MVKNWRDLEVIWTYTWRNGANLFGLNMEMWRTLYMEKVHSIMSYGTTVIDSSQKRRIHKTKKDKKRRRRIKIPKGERRKGG